MMDGFQIGDRVFAKDYAHSGIGYIVCDAGDGWYGIRFDEFSDILHDLAGECEFGYGRWYEPHHLEFINDGMLDDEDIDVGDLL